MPAVQPLWRGSAEKIQTTDNTENADEAAPAEPSVFSVLSVVSNSRACGAR